MGKRALYVRVEAEAAHDEELDEQGERLAEELFTQFAVRTGPRSFAVFAVPKERGPASDLSYGLALQMILQVDELSEEPLEILFDDHNGGRRPH